MREYNSNAEVRARRLARDRAARAQFTQADRQVIRDQHTSMRDRCRREALEHYGGKCACCGESTFQFLAIDHINGNGGQHAKRNGYNRAGFSLVLWLRKNRYPRGFRVLCHNCNCAIAWYGECPHGS